MSSGRTAAAFQGLPGRFVGGARHAFDRYRRTLSFAAATASAAGVVNVTFVDPDKFSRRWQRPTQRSRTTWQSSSSHLKDLGQRYLPDGQVLNISVLGVDMAGYTRPPLARRGGSYEIRIARFAADWPRITLRYSLESNGQPIKNGEEVVADVFTGATVRTTASSIR